MGERQDSSHKRNFFRGLVLASALGCLYGCSERQDSAYRTGTILYHFQGYDRNDQVIPGDLDRNEIPELAEVNLENRTLTRILWGDYLNIEEKNSDEKFHLGKNQNPKIRFVSQINSEFQPSFQQSSPYKPLKNLEPIPRPAPQPPAPPSPEPLATPEPSQQEYKQFQTTPDFTKTPMFKIRKPFGEVGYFDTIAMKARHPDTMIDYTNIERQARKQFEKNLDSD